MNFPEYIEKKYLDWQRNQGKRKTIDEFAAYIGVSQPTLSQWMSGKRTPGIENANLLAEIFGNEVYDVLEIPRPNPYLQRLNRVWEFLPEAIQKQIAEDAETYETKNEVQRTEQTHQRRKARKVK